MQRLAAICRYAWLVVALIVICTLVEGVLSLGDWGLLPVPRLRLTVYEYAGFWPGLLGSWRPNYPAQPWLMFLSYAFLHGGPMHLIFNMVTLWSLGLATVDRVGNRGFALVYGAAVLGGALAFGLMTRSPQPMVGASGGLFGLAGALLAWNLADRRAAALKLSPVLRAVVGLILLNVLMWWLMNGLLAWQTHLGGFVCGWGVALLLNRGAPPPLAPEPPPAPSRPAR